MDAWLDSLSEDWNSQPQSSSSKSLPDGTPSSSIRKFADGAFHNGSVHPRSGSARSDNPPAASVAMMAERKILVERSHSDNNILEHPSIAWDNASIIQRRSPRKPPSKTGSTSNRASRSSTVASAQSVIMHGTTNRKSLSSSPPKQRNNYATPDWKKLVLGEGQGLAGQKDLFSPIGLEGIFSRPPQSSLRKTPGALSFWRDMDSMPSSPPPWSSRRTTHKSLRQATSLRRKSALGILSEQEEGVTRLEDDLDELDDESLQSSQKSDLKEHASNNILHGTKVDRSASRGTLDGQVDGYQEFLLSDELEELRNQELQESALPPLPLCEEQFSEPPRTEASSSHPNSSQSAAFSPVFISKRNTIDGKVDYVPLDLSNPEMIDQLEKLSIQSAVKSVSQVPSHVELNLPSTSPHPSSPEVGHYDKSFTNSENDHIGGFVNTERGGRSDDGSFKRRPLSPWESCSVGPSDSVSQVNTHNTHRSDAHFIKVANVPHVEPRTITTDKQNLYILEADDDDGLSKKEDILPITTFGESLDQALSDVSTSSTKSADTTVHQSQSTRNPGTNLIVEEQFPEKRPASVVMGQSSPKRQRTLCQLEIATISEHVSDMVATQRHRMQAAAVVVGGQDTSGSDRILGRNTIKPSGSAQTSPIPSCGDDCEADVQESMPLAMEEQLDAVYEHIDQMVVPCDLAEVAQIKAVAAEVATFRLKSAAKLNGGFRKQSVSTKDYVDEAMKIMELIRSKRRPQSILSSLEDHEYEDSPEWDFDNLDPMSPQPISRPPSRDGALNAWRTRNARSLDPRVLSQLRKYQEAGDESFLTSACPEDLELVEDEVLSQPEIESDLANVRISGPIGMDGPRRVITPVTSKSANEGSESPIKTNSSEGTNSTTYKTTSSQTTRTVPIIAAQRVALPEIVAGMRFDATKHAWVKHATPETATHEIRCDSDDPFDDITDLSVHDDEPAKSEQTDHGKSHDTDEDDDTIEMLPTAHINELENRTPKPSIKRKPQMLSVTFSSPPTFHEHAPMYRWRNGGDLSTVQDEELEEGVSDESDLKHTLPRPRQPSLSFPATKVRSSQRQFSLRNQVLDRNLSAAYLEEHREVSLVQTRPDGRTMSLTLSLSTPLPTRTSSYGQIIPTTGELHTGYHSLSPLSDFTLHQDDDHHMQARKLVPLERSCNFGTSSHKPAQVVDSLVTKLAAAEPDEPYWDWMHVLDLAAKEVDSLYSLSEFCPRIEHLDVSNNKLSHLEGAPFTIRQLHAQGNKLSSLTNWGHLSNLQYLDVSGNELESLDGFAGLIHLRELKASDNKINSIKGILDLDGLLSLILSNNKFESIDLQDAGFTRLTSLDVSNNKLTEVLGLEAMSELTCLDISNNNLQAFPSLETNSDQIPGLEILRCTNNSMEHLEITQMPKLRVLHADFNKLESISGIQGHESVDTVSLREQDPECGPFLAANIDSFAEIRNLYLSGNNLPSLPITCHFLNLQTLEVAFTGLTALPANFGTLVPNLRTLNLNSNSLKDLRFLRGIFKLRRLHVAENRLSRLRKTMSVVERFASSLEELDLRNNPFSLGFHASVPTRDVVAETGRAEDCTLQHLLPAADADKDARHLARLDEDTRLRRRVYELLLGTKCTKLASVDGLKFSAATALRRDDVWERLLRLGVVEKTGGDGTEESLR